MSISYQEALKRVKAYELARTTREGRTLAKKLADEIKNCLRLTHSTETVDNETIEKIAYLVNRIRNYFYLPHFKEEILKKRAIKIATQKDDEVIRDIQGNVIPFSIGSKILLGIQRGPDYYIICNLGGLSGKNREALLKLLKAVNQSNSPSYIEQNDNIHSSFNPTPFTTRLRPIP